MDHGSGLWTGLLVFLLPSGHSVGLWDFPVDMDITLPRELTGPSSSQTLGQTLYLYICSQSMQKGESDLPTVLFDYISGPLILQRCSDIPVDCFLLSRLSMTVQSVDNHDLDSGGYHPGSRNSSAGLQAPSRLALCFGIDVGNAGMLDTRGGHGDSFLLVACQSSVTPLHVDSCFLYHIRRHTPP